MGLHLVGKTIDKTRSHYLAESGKLVQLMRGIYVDAADDIDATIMKHAVRVAHYLYPRAYLSAASASLLGPTRDGRLFLSGRRKQRTRIRSLEIIQNQGPDGPSLGTATIDDGLGEFQVEVSSIRQRFLEAFRRRSEHATSIDDSLRDAIAARLIEEYRSPKEAADAVWDLARQIGWLKEGEQAERSLVRRANAAPAENEAALDLIVAWHGAPIGHLVHQGFEWRWNPDQGQSALPLIRQTTPGKLPPFILSLLPEGWLESVLRNRDERATLQSGKRYMSNIAVLSQSSDLLTLPADLLLSRLDSFADGGIFNGRYLGPGRDDFDRSFERNLARLFDSAETPRLSGIQIKAPMYLGPDGSLAPAVGRPFTHILKPAGTGGFERLPIVEWLAMRLGRAVGLEVPATALVAMPDGMPPALLVERFDIRQALEDRRLLALEDLCSVLDLPSEAKYQGTMERVARAVRPLSTAPEADLIVILKRALFAWLIADGDLHLKNLALLKIAEPGDRQFRSVRMAPLYDAVTTRVFPRLERDRMALKLNGKDDRLKRADFLAWARIAGLRASDSEVAIDDMLERLARAAGDLTVPDLPGMGPGGAAAAEEIAGIIRARIGTFE